MARSAAFQTLARAIRIARFCDRHGLSSREGLERAAALEAAVDGGASRRKFLTGAAKVAALGGIGAVAGPLGRAGAAPRPPSRDVAIIGAGLAGLACGDELQRHGVRAMIYEASDRAGGRCFSLGGAFRGPVDFPGQVVERGGEFIDTEHKAMIGYTHRFGLTLEDVTKRHKTDVFYHFFGRHHAESDIVDELRQFVPAMRDDLRTVGLPTADSFTPADTLLDRTNLKEYLEARGAGNLIKAVIDVAYTIEYGLEIDRQSCLNFLFFIHADRRSRFTPFGVFSDERYHVIGGNQQIPAALAAGLNGQIQYGMTLQQARKTPAGRIELTFRRGASTISATHDAVVLAIPFSVLRDVTLDASLDLPAWKLFAIQNLAYGTNAKMMLGFVGPMWLRLGSDGGSFSDLPNHQNTWETNPIAGTSAHAVLTDYSGGNRGARLNPRRVQSEATRFLEDLDKVYPGARTAATRDARGNLLAHLEHWPSNPLTKGAYTCNQPGYFTTIAGNEQKPVGTLFFAGEHTNSFYQAQGFMEGGVLSGLRAAAEVLQAV